MMFRLTVSNFIISSLLILVIISLLIIYLFLLSNLKVFSTAQDFSFKPKEHAFLKNERINVKENNFPEPVKIIYDYVEFSKNGELSKIKDITVDISNAEETSNERNIGNVTSDNDILVIIKPIDEKKRLEESIRTAKRNIGKTSSKSSEDETLHETSIIDKIDYQILVYSDPIFIKKNGFEISQYLVKQLDKSKCQVKINFIDRKGNESLSQDYYLINLGDKRWKIYKVIFPSGFTDF